MMNKIKRSCAFHDTDVQGAVAQLDAIIARYEGNGLLNDALYAQANVQRLRHRGMSRRLVMEKLQQKGLSAAHISAALAEFEAEDNNGEDSEFSAALALARRKKLGPFRAANAREDYAQKDMNALGRAGFSFDIARRVMKFSEGDG